MTDRFKFPAVLALLAVVVLWTTPPLAQKDEVAGTVTRIQGAAVAMQDALPRVLKAGDKIRTGDVISTGKDARIEVRMFDDGLISLGQKTVFVVIDYIAEGSSPKAMFQFLKGAFKATSGNMMQTADASFVVKTPIATIGIRGTTFWGGTLDGDFQVALLDGKGVYVETKTGRVDITNVGYGTRVRGEDQPPAPPKPWHTGMVDRAKASVAFR